MSESEVRNVAVDFTGKLDTNPDELLTGTPTVAEQVTSNLKISNQSVNTVELTVNGKTVAIGKAVQFKVVAGANTAGQGNHKNGEYELLVTVSTDATPAQTLTALLILEVIEDA